MLVARRVSPWLILLFLLTGCGRTNLVKPTGRLLKGGEPYLPADKDTVQIVFARVDVGDASTQGPFPADFDPDDGTFQVLGAQGAGLPPGKYRVAIQVLRKKKDVLKGAFTPGTSPIVREVNGSEISPIDLDKPNG